MENRSNLARGYIEELDISITRTEPRTVHVTSEIEPSPETLQYLHALTGKQILFTLAKSPVLKKAASDNSTDAVKLLNKSIDSLPRDSRNEDLEDLVNREPVIRFVNLLFEDAIRRNASDIHIEPFEGRINIRVRVDGVLFEHPAPDVLFYNAIVSRIKILSGMDIAQKRLPQDGRYTIKQDNQTIDLRVSTIPTLHGESLVLRLLNKKSGLISIEELGWEKSLTSDIRRMIHSKQGLILVTGPTGSGKSTTLYAFLQELNNGSSKIITIEDPVEYQVDGINQIPVNPDINLTFARGLRSILRQDPDIIMVGEVRDGETAKIAVQSSLTGHLVLSTLHTNDSISAITRLTDLGVENYLLAPSLKFIIAQRLLRKICPFCKKSYKPPVDLVKWSGLKNKKKFVKGAGCPKCGHTGYLGRTAIFEVFKLSDNIKEIIAKKFSEQELMKAALREGFKPLSADAFDKVRQDITTLEEVDRVIER